MPPIVPVLFAAAAIALCQLFGSSLLVHAAAETLVLDVCNDTEAVNGNCSNINETLTMRLSSNTVVQLRSGKHTIHAFTLHSSIDNVSFVGLGAAPDVIVTCDEGIGLAFFNVSNIRFQNITIDGCGLSGHNWMEVLDTKNEIIDEVIKIPATNVPTVTVALFVAHCENLTMESVNVSNTLGIGLLAVNAVGSMLLNSANFERNIPPECSLSITVIDPIISDFRKWIGGGAYFLYEDYKFINGSSYSPPYTRLEVTESRFLDNQDCGVVGSIEQYIEYSAAIRDLGYYVGAAGGLSVMLAQVGYPVDVVVRSTVFRKNLAKFGGGVHIGMFAGTSNNHITILDCSFEQNGNHSMYSGGALIAFFELWRQSQFTADSLVPEMTRTNNITLEVINTTFTKNAAFSGGAVFLASQYTEETHSQKSSIRVYFRGCRFVSNSGMGGSALLVYERKESAADPGMQVELCDTEIINSLMLPSSFASNAFGGAVSARAINLTISGDSRFLNNSGTALVGIRSLINMMGNIVFFNNNGIYGGAVYLLDLAFLIVHRDTEILFDSNSASISGGALYVELYVHIDEFRYSYDDCFLYFEKLNAALCTNSSCPNPTELNISITFRRNVAQSGSAIFGSTLGTCPWLVTFRDSEERNFNLSILQNLNDNTRLVTFDPPPVDSSQVSTPSEYISLSEEFVYVMPGQRFTVAARILDRFNQPIAEGITSDTMTTGRAQLGDSGFWLLSEETLATPITVTGNQNQTIDVVLYSTATSASGRFTAILTLCLTGFVYDNNTKSCVCEERLLDKNVICNVDSREHEVPEHVWYGPLNDDIADYTKDNNDMLVVHSCVLGYCKLGRKSVSVGEYSSQCKEDYHRDKFLCGSCQDGYSIQLGSYRCRKCTHYSLFMFGFFIAAGAALVLLMASLHMTVTEGYIYSILFYSNIVDTFVVEFSPDLPGSGVFVFMSFFSLNLGFEACLYDGMDSLARTGLRLAFVGYVLAIIGFIFLAARSMKLARWMKNYSPVKILTTLMILSYIAVLQICIGIISGIQVETLDGSAETRWYVDPTLPYFVRAHGFLGLLSILLILLYIIPLPLFGLFPKKVYQWKRIKKFKPFFDALWAPFKMEYRFWLGVRLIVRWVLFGFSYFLRSPHNLFALGLLLVALLFVQTKIQPFRGFWRNLIDDCLVANLIVLTIGTLYFKAIEDDGSTRQSIFSTVVAFLAYVIFVGILIRHLFLRFPRMKEYIMNLPTKIRGIFNKSPVVEQSKNTGAKGDTKQTQEVSNVRRETDLERIEMMDDSIWQTYHLEGDAKEGKYTQTGDLDLEAGSPNYLRQRVISFTELREPLLEDEGEIEISTSSATFTGQYEKAISTVLPIVTQHCPHTD